MSTVDTSGIYAITNIVNGKRYVGSAVNINLRLINHKTNLIAGKHCNLKLQMAWNKYGKEAFCFSVLELCGNESLLIREQSHIDAKSEYNICMVAGSALGVKRSKERCKQQGDFQRERMKNPEYRAEVLAHLTSDEAKQKSAAAVRTPKERARRSNILKDPQYKARQMARLQSPEAREKMRVSCRTPEIREKRSIAAKIRMASPEMIAFTHSEDARVKRSASLKALWKTPEYREKVCASRKEQRAQIIQGALCQL